MNLILKGIVVDFQYDTNGQTKKADGETLSDWQYEYDLNGNRTVKAGCFAGSEDKLRNTIIRYRYDQMDRLAEEAYDDETVRYHYDLCGNRLKREDKSFCEEYTYNVKNQLLSKKSEKAEVCYQYDQ